MGKRRGQCFALRSAYLSGCFVLFFCPRLSAQEFKNVPLGYWPAAKDRLELIVDEDWSIEAGVRMIPYRLRYASGKPGTQDHSFQLLTFNNSEIYPSRALQRLDSQVVIIPSGSASVEGRILIPQHQHEGSFAYELIGPGVKFSQPSRVNRSYYGSSAAFFEDSLWSRATLLWHSELPDFDERLQDFELSTKPGPGGILRSPNSSQASDYWEKLPMLPSTSNLDRSASTPELVARSRLDWKQLKKLNTSEAGEDWLAYSCFQQMLITLEDASQLKEKEPLRWQAIRNWLATGGMLLMLDTGEHFEKRDQVEELFDFDRAENTAGDGWFAANAALLRTEFVEANDEAAYQKPPPIRLSPLQPSLHHFQKISRVDNSEQITKWQADFLLRPYGLGFVVLAEVPSRYGAWDELSSFACEGYPDLQNRAGFFLEGFDEPDLLRIPGVGDPPVNAFRFLITLFFAIVGPLNYFLLRSQRRLHLMLFTVPAFALVACTGLIFYSLFADGIRTRGRIVSYSQIDQRSKQLVSYSRQAYYSPLSAEDNLVFSMDTAVFPVVTDSDNSPFLTKISDGVQTLSGGNLQARVDNQYLAIRSSSTEAGLELIGDDALQFRNLLGGTIHCAIIRDAEGNFFLTEQLAAGEIGTATPCSLLTAAGQLDLYLKDVRADLASQAPRRPLANYQSPQDVIGASLNQNVHQLAHNSYLAIVDNSTEIPVLQPKARFEASLNMIQGSW